MNSIERLKTLPAADRKMVFDSEALAIEDGTYTKPLTEDELADFKDQLAERSIQQAIILDELKNIKDEFKERLKPVARDISNALQAIKFKAVECSGKVYRMADYDDQMIYNVDEDGNIISSRRMRPEERQFRIQALKEKSA